MFDTIQYSLIYRIWYNYFKSNSIFLTDDQYYLIDKPIRTLAITPLGCIFTIAEPMKQEHFHYDAVVVDTCFKCDSFAVTLLFHVCCCLLSGHAHVCFTS